jgi:hypothetical protein
VSTFQGKSSVSLILGVVSLLVCLLIAGCDLVPITNTKPMPTATTKSIEAQPTAQLTLPLPTPTLPLPTPTLPLLAARQGYHVVFRQQGNLVIGHQQSIIGGFTTSTVFTIHVICFGTGSVEVNLGTYIDDKYDCQTSQDITNEGITDNVDTNGPPTANAHYTILASIFGPALWEVFIEAQL